MVRNNYFRPWSEDARPAGSDEILILRRKQPEPRIRAVEQGSSDIMNLDKGGLRFEPAPLARVLNRYPGRVSVGPVLATRFMFLNVREPPFDDLRVRRAVNFATDRARMVELSNGPSAAEPSCQMVPPSIPGAAPYCPYTVRLPRREPGRSPI